MDELTLCMEGENMSPWCTYTRRTMATKLYDSKFYNRWGQRKLLMTEVAFLTHYNCSIIIYAGSACGIHIKFLASLYPEKTFYLIDPAPFDRDLTLMPNIILQSTFFTDECVDEILKVFEENDIDVSKEVGFISDIRSDNATPSKKNIKGEQRVEDGVLNDMNMQMGWVEKLKPAHCMLKFRLPYVRGMSENVEVKNTIDYLDGKIMMQLYSPEQSSETRLIASYDPNNKNNPYKKRKYDCELYENQLYYYNRYTRIRRYDIPDDIYKKVFKFKSHAEIPKRAELGIECQLWREYLRSKNIPDTNNNVLKLINDATLSIFESYSKGIVPVL